MDDAESFAKAVEGAKKFEYNSERLVMLVSNFEASSAMQAELEKSVNSQKIKLMQVTNECVLAERLLAIHNLTKSKYIKLENMGFGLPMLTMLHDTIHEVASANKISHDLAVQKFLDDIAENFSPILGYDSKLTAMRSEIEKKRSDLIALSTALDSKKEMTKVLGLLFLTGGQDKINDLPLSLQCKPKHKQDQVTSSTAHGGLNRLAEDSNQNIELAKDHVDSAAVGIGDPVDVQHRMAHHTVITGLFPWTPSAFVRGECPPSLHTEDLEDIREMQELAFARNTSNTEARGG
ncbi:MAG: hypothetical protein M3Y53_05795 [Thermoproteota archaeon]|nr:hypothetical protein [Thermoproteota archaeon]